MIQRRRAEDPLYYQDYLQIKPVRREVEEKKNQKQYIRRINRILLLSLSWLLYRIRLVDTYDNKNDVVTVLYLVTVVILLYPAFLSSILPIFVFAHHVLWVSLHTNSLSL